MPVNPFFLLLSQRQLENQNKAGLSIVMHSWKKIIKKLMFFASVGILHSLVANYMFK